MAKKKKANVLEKAVVDTQKDCCLRGCVIRGEASGR
ncbi:unnamed protein product [Musa acuminata subsp. malaccensis]|uniref:Uncharacterized protein n=1 Tax=Musa acuminata subsp. malaccensis TaxID=214687 RepID=A0A804U5Q2_MUSAM|nr:unnamed protein product [Musa acuminata subsp. malaccensis]